MGARFVREKQVLRFAQNDNQKSKGNGKGKYGDLSAASAKSADAGRDDDCVGKEEFPRGLKPVEIWADYGGAEAPPFQSADAIVGSGENSLRG
ncbi:MAG: hypothetical protein WBY53_16950 [Acidobacteriaceae bacterium]